MTRNGSMPFWTLDRVGETLAHILARKRQVPFYAGAIWEWLPYGALDDVLRYAAAHGARYLVVDEATTPDLRPQLAPLLDPVNAPANLAPVYDSATFHSFWYLPLTPML